MSSIVLHNVPSFDACSTASRLSLQKPLKHGITPNNENDAEPVTVNKKIIWATDLIQDEDIVQLRKLCKGKRVYEHVDNNRFVPKAVHDAVTDGLKRTKGPNKNTAYKNALSRKKRRERAIERQKNGEEKGNVSLNPKHERRTTFYGSSVESIAHFKRTKPGFKGMRASAKDITSTFEDLDEVIYVPSQKGIHDIFTDAKGRIFAVKVSPPPVTTKGDLVQSFEKALQVLETNAHFPKSNATQGRATWGFKTLSFGKTLGAGSTEPHDLNLKNNDDTVAQFKKDPMVQYWIKHISNSWTTWFPKLKKFYDNNEKQLADIRTSMHNDQEPLRGAFDGLPQGACTCNLGPATVTPMHRDSENLSFGVCMVSVFGDFDWKNGGELFLLEPGVIVQMRPGDLLIFPSASITHGNFPLSSQKDQKRFSFTCYTAASLFQWVENNGKLPKDVNQPAIADCDAGWSLYKQRTVHEIL